MQADRVIVEARESVLRLIAAIEAGELEAEPAFVRSLTAVLSVLRDLTDDTVH